MSKKRKKNQHAKWERVLWVGLGCFVVMLIVVFIACFFLINRFSDHLVWANVFLQLLVACFALLLTVAFTLGVVSARKMIAKIAVGFFSVMFFLVTVVSIVTCIQLLQDKEFYERGEYMAVVGRPSNIEYNRPKRSDIFFVDSFEVDGVEIITDHLAIEQNYFDSHLKDGMVVVKYLPHSHYAVEVY